MIRSAKLALPIHRLDPLKTHWSPSRRAEVSSATESEPWSGSMRAKAPTLFNPAMSGNQRCFCSSLPSSAMVPIDNPVCTPMKVLTLPSPRDISRISTPAASGLIPGQP